MVLKRYRLIVCLSHQIQYKSPLLERLAKHEDIDLMVYYYSDIGLRESKNSTLGKIHKWDRPLLSNYPYEILQNLFTTKNWRFHLISPFMNPGLIQRLSKDNYDAVIIHSYQYPSDWLAFWTSKINNKPVLFYGEMYPRGKLSIVRQLSRKFIHHPMIRGVDACLAIGSVAKDVFLREYQISPERVFLAPYAVDNEYFIQQNDLWNENKTKIKKDFGIPADFPVILCVAVMVQKKRHQDLIVAMSKMSRPAKLVLVGHGPLIDEVRSLAKKVFPETLITGFVNQTELPKYYAIADIFVLPSLWEEFGLVINEAMCSRLPIIASNKVAASIDLVRDDENGYTFSPGDVDSLAQKLELLIADPEKCRRFGERSLEIISDWSYDQTIKGILAALEYTTAQYAK